MDRIIAPYVGTDRTSDPTVAVTAQVAMVHSQAVP
jgi:hypothetical protein